MTPRLYLPDARQAGSIVSGDAEQAHYIGRVLRLRAGAALQVFDGQGRRFAATLTALDDRRCQVSLDQPLAALPDGPLHITLLQGISSAEKMDWTIEKAVELGVATIVPVSCTRSIVRLSPEKAQRRHMHWQRLIIAACMQCGRDRLPVLAPVATLPGLTGPVLVELESAGPAPAGAAPLDSSQRLLLAVPGSLQQGQSMSAWPASGPSPRRITLLAGPEAGFDAQEIDTALRLGFMPVTLGPRILRTETAALTALAALQVKFGDF